MSTKLNKNDACLANDLQIRLIQGAKDLPKPKNIVPSSKMQLKFKKLCRLSKEDIFVSENEVRVKLQALLNKTVARLLFSNPQIGVQILDLKKKFGTVRLEYIYKLGM